MYDSSNTNVLGHAGRIFSLTEGAMPYELTRELDTIAQLRLRRTAADRSFSRAKSIPVTGELHGVKRTRGPTRT